MQMFKPQPYIVLVDDDDDERYIMSHAFSKIGWVERVKFMSSPDDLFAYLKKLPDTSYPSLVVLDYHMPRTNGMEALHYLKSQDGFKVIPVSVYSSSLPSGMEQQLLAMGARSCHLKRFAVSGAIELAEALRDIAQGSLAT